jgi:hypothetical protein
MKHVHLVSLTALLAWCIAGAGQAAPGKTPDLDKHAGVYKQRFENGLVSGETYISEDIFELVKVSKGAAYFRVHMEFFNGHECNLWGIAELTAAALVYHGPVDYDGKPCVFNITADGDGIVFDDVGGACRNLSCGARGGYGNGEHFSASFMHKSRRPIRYMRTLLASTEYTEAAAEYEHWRRTVRTD